MRYLIILFTLTFTACDWAKKKTKDTVNTTGEVIGKAGSELADGVAKGVEKTFQSKVVFSDELNKAGLKSGRISVSGSDSTTDNIVTAYLIFENDFKKEIIIKVISADGLEYGRARQEITGNKDDAKYFDFIFDDRTNIDRRSTLQFE